MPLPLLDSGLPDPAAGVFTTRAGGVSAPPWDSLNLALHVHDDVAQVKANRRVLAEELGVAELAFAEQVHGAGVAVVDAVGSRAGQGGLAGVDALVTTRRGVGLVVMAADCLPVLLADPVSGVVAAAHAGRQGVVAGVLQETVRVMSELGARPERTAAVIGPAAGGCCYEVPEEMADEVERHVPGSRATTRRGTPSVDLRAGAQAVLSGLGLRVGHVEACTVDDPRFYSYRRDRTTGRHAGVVHLR